MKFGKTIKKKKDSLADKVNTGSRKVPKWMETNPDEIRRRAEEQKTQMFSNRPPEFFLLEDETRNIRFRTDTPVCISQYTIPTGRTRAGNQRFDKFTAPPDGEEDLFAEAGKVPSFRAIYEIIDLTGYKDPKKGRVKNIPRFWNVAMKQYEAFEAMRKKYGSLKDREWSVTKTGSGKQSSTMVMPEERSPMPEKLKELPRLMKDFEKYYAPPDEKRQKQLLKHRVDTDDED